MFILRRAYVANFYDIPPGIKALYVFVRVTIIIGMIEFQY